MVGCGIGPGDEVLVPGYTWVATAAAPLAVGAVPVLTEINQSLTIDPEDIRRKISPRMKAIIVVHMLNLVCDMDAIMAIAKEYDILVIEHACQAVGVTYRGRCCGTIGDAGAFSFNATRTCRPAKAEPCRPIRRRIHARASMYHDVGSYMREGRATPRGGLYRAELPYYEPRRRDLARKIPRLDKKMKLCRDRRRYWLDKLSGPFGNNIK